MLITVRVGVGATGEVNYLSERSTVKDYTKGGILRKLKATGVTYRIWELSWLTDANAPARFWATSFTRADGRLAVTTGTHRIADGEALPGPNDFGRWAWAHPTFDRAFKAAIVVRPPQVDGRPPVTEYWTNYFETHVPPPDGPRPSVLKSIKSWSGSA